MNSMYKLQPSIFNFLQCVCEIIIIKKYSTIQTLNLFTCIGVGWFNTCHLCKEKQDT